MYERTFTVFTPTFNRAASLHRVYESLVADVRDFEWLIVDDGSTDGTSTLIEAGAERHGSRFDT
jgi:glycosyltransferase involved in cell wall biosynthesis